MMLRSSVLHFALCGYDYAVIIMDWFEYKWSTGMKVHNGPSVCQTRVLEVNDLCTRATVQGPRLGWGCCLRHGRPCWLGLGRCMATRQFQSEWVWWSPRGTMAGYPGIGAPWRRNRGGSVSCGLKEGVRAGFLASFGSFRWGARGRGRVVGGTHGVGCVWVGGSFVARRVMIFG